MEKEILELIRKNKNNLQRHTNERFDLRNKIHFCSKHKFEEEVRVSNLKLNHIDGIIYEYEEMIKDLEKIIKSYENKK